MNECVVCKDDVVVSKAMSTRRISLRIFVTCPYCCSDYHYSLMCSKVMAAGTALLSGFHLVRVGLTKYQYKYTFVHNAGYGEVIERQTAASYDDGGKVAALAGHTLKAPPGWGIKGFQLVRPTKDTIAYKYWVQKLWKMR